MTKTKADRRRKRGASSSSTATNPSWTAVPLILLAGFILSVLLSASDEDPSVNSNQPPVEQRRFLTSEGGEHVLDIGEENVWNRQLRARGGGNNRKLQQRSVSEVADELDMGGSDRPSRRMALIPRYTDKHHFEECVGQTIEECQTLIDTFVQANPDQFNNQTSLWLDIRKIRELTDMSYYKVVIRTNEVGNQAYGIFDDGVIYYPWPWRAGGQDTSIGPWDCQELGVYMSPADCCAMIQADVPQADDSGNYLACFVEEPVGGPNNPEREDRAIVVTDGTGKVVRAPVAH